MTYSNLKSVQEPGEMPTISPSAYSAIKHGNLTRKEREQANARSLSEESKERIRQFWFRNSRLCPNNNFVVKRASKHNPVAQTLPLYFREYSIKESYERFQIECPDLKIARSTLHKYKPANIKKPRSRQDCCPICKQYRLFKNIVEKRETTLLSTKEQRIKNQFEFHQDMKKSREDQFAMDINMLQEGETVIVMDFKANITLGRGPEEDSHVFFSAPQRTVFGAVAYTVKGEDTYKTVFTIVSPVLKHDSLTLVSMLRSCVFNHQLFKYFDVKKAHIWMDNAPQHFRNMETLASFHDLSNEFSWEIQLNYFAEYHGKSECDRHFGWLSSLYKEKTRYHRCSDVTTTEEFLQMYTSGVRERGGHVIPSIGASFIELNPESSHKLNVVAATWEHSGVSDFMNALKIAPEDSSEEKRRKNKLSKNPFMFHTYTKRSLVFGKNSDGITFVLNYFYEFTFNQHKTDLQCRLKRNSKQQWTFPFTVEEESRNYKVKLGVATSRREDFADLRRVSLRQSFHEDALEAEMEQNESHLS